MGDNSKWKAEWFSKARVAALTYKQKSDLRHQQRDYRKSVEEKKQEIRGHNEEIQKLEKIIEDERPSINGGKYVHGRCGLKTAIHYGRIPGGGSAGGDNLAYCLFCDDEYRL
ncbi:MAG: hypothetical protein IH845_02810 [Nanoarchaeota archaeon]|nr:hypothetical protein [Nanoarchaeota archaeon]